MKKALIISSVASMIDQFNKENIKILQELGYEVHVATNFNNPGTITFEKSEMLKKYLRDNNVIYHQINFSRSPFKILKMLRSYNELLKLAKKFHFELCHMHSPVGGLIGRLVFSKMPTKTIYTAHGFHFYKGASIVNWICFYPLEKYLSKLTDTIITINTEDYAIASTNFFSNVEYVPGVGVDSKVYGKELNEFEKNNVRNKLSIKKSDFILTCIGELNKNKNQSFLIKAMKNLDENVKLFLIGKGEKCEELTYLIEKLDLNHRVFLLGYRSDISEILSISNILVASSYREGLPVNIIEGMIAGLPVVSFNNRGARDLIENGVNGFLVSNNEDEYRNCINTLYQNDRLTNEMRTNNKKKSIYYSKEEINKKIKRIYEPE